MSSNRPCQPRVVESSVFWLDHWEIWGPSQRCWGFLTHLCEAQDQQTLDPKNYSGVGTYGDIFFVLCLVFHSPPPKKKKLKNKETPVSASLSSSGSLITISNRGKVRSRHLEKILGAFLWLSYWCLPWQWAREGQVFASHERWCLVGQGMRD